MGAFDTYLQLLNQRTQMRAEEYARNQAQKMLAIQSVSQIGGEIANTIKQNRELKGLYQSAWKQNGAPMINEARTPTDEAYDSIRTKIDAIKAGLAGTTERYTQTGKPQKMKEINALDKRIADIS